MMAKSSQRYSGHSLKVVLTRLSSPSNLNVAWWQYECLRTPKKTRPYSLPECDMHGLSCDSQSSSKAAWTWFPVVYISIGILVFGTPTPVTHAFSILHLQTFPNCLHKPVLKAWTPWSGILSQQGPCLLVLMFCVRFFFYFILKSLQCILYWQIVMCCLSSLISWPRKQGYLPPTYVSDPNMFVPKCPPRPLAWGSRPRSC